MAKNIQEQFGQSVIYTLKSFVKQDIRTVAQFEADEFSHIGNQKIRRTICETLYGSRYMYKLGLAPLTDNIEQY